MEYLWNVLLDAFAYLRDFGPDLRSIIVLTLVVSLAATVIGAGLGIPGWAGPDIDWYGPGDK